jgi:hypothetical protein
MPRNHSILPVPGGRGLSTLAALALGALLSGCRSTSTVVVTSVPSEAPATAPASGGSDASVSAAALSGWRIESREHVDLWLHGFAMLQGDSSLVPYFRPGYRAELQELRKARGISTLLDANAQVLQARLAQNPNLTSAQFLAMYFASWTDLRTGTERFLRDGGEVRAARSNESLRMYATLGTYFPTAADREWLRLFISALEAERQGFFRSYWNEQQQARSEARTAFLAEWNSRYAAAFARFLHASSQRTGTLLLSLPLGGEGRSLNAGQRDNFMAVGLSRSAADWREMLYTLAHEAVGTISNTAVRDHASPASDRAGESGVWMTLAPVRGGAMLLERIAPELADGYRRYYLQLARQRLSADVLAQFNTIFPLPSSLVTSLERQIQTTLDGI